MYGTRAAKSVVPSLGRLEDRRAEQQGKDDWSFFLRLRLCCCGRRSPRKRHIRTLRDWVTLAR